MARTKGPCRSSSLDRKTTNTQDPDKHKHRHTQLRQDSLHAPKIRGVKSVPEAGPLQSHVSTVVPASPPVTIRVTTSGDYLRPHSWVQPPQADRQIATGRTLQPSRFEKTCLQHLPPGALPLLRQKCQRTHRTCTLSAGPRERGDHPSPGPLPPQL